MFGIVQYITYDMKVKIENYSCLAFEPTPACGTEKKTFDVNFQAIFYYVFKSIGYLEYNTNLERDCCLAF